jgi:hypothetical protein
MSQTLDVASPSPQTEITRDSFPDWVLAEILRTAGPQVPYPPAAEILQAFWDRFGPDKALLVCSLAFGRHHGFWRGAPVTPLRFRDRQDEFFALAVLGAGDGGE